MKEPNDHKSCVRFCDANVFLTLSENAEGLHEHGKNSKEFEVLAIDGEDAEDEYDDMPPLVGPEDVMPPLVKRS